MKKFLLILTLFFASIGIFYAYTPVVHPNIAAIAAAASAARRHREEQEHKEEYHKGSISSYSEYIEVWEKDEFGKDVIYKYEKIYYYYSIDPKRCIQNIQTKGPISTRYPTEQEIKNREDEKIFLIFIITCFISVIVASIIVSQIKSKIEQKNNDLKYVYD